MYYPNITYTRDLILAYYQKNTIEWDTGQDVIYRFFFTGHPSPRVMWNVRGDNINDMYGTRIDDQTVANVLRIDRVHRTNLGRKFVCEASNVPNTVQLSTSVTVDVYRE